MLQKKVRSNVLRLPEGIRPESVQKAHAVMQAFAKNLHALGSIEAAAAKTTDETGTRVTTKTKPKST